MNQVWKQDVADYQAAITTVRAGGSATVNGRTFTNTEASLSELFDRESLAQYRVAKQAILEGAQSYQIGDRSLSRADLEFIEGQISRLSTALDRVVAGVTGIRLQQAVPR